VNMDTKTEKGFLARIFFMRWLQALYEWVLHWAETPYGEIALFLIAFAESSFFPIPPDVLLIVLALGIPKRSFRYAGECLVGSVFGGALGYLIGLFLFDTVGIKIIEFYGLLEQYYKFQLWYEKYNFWIIFTAGFTPLPYKVFTISAGVAKVNFWIFLFASIVSRGARFFLVGGLIWKFGDPIKVFIEKYFDKLVVVFTVLLVGGFILLKFVFPHSTIDQNYIWDLDGDTKPERVHFWSKEKPNKELQYFMEAISSDGKVLFHQKVFSPKFKFHPAKHGKPKITCLDFQHKKYLIAQIFSEKSPSTIGILMVYLPDAGGLQKLAEYSYDYYREAKKGTYLLREVIPQKIVEKEARKFLVVEEVVKEYSQAEKQGKEISRAEIRIPLSQK